MTLFGKGNIKSVLLRISLEYMMDFVVFGLLIYIMLCLIDIEIEFIFLAEAQIGSRKCEEKAYFYSPGTGMRGKHKIHS